MTKVNITIKNERFSDILNLCKLIDLFDNSFAFEFQNDRYSIKFYKDENGKNIVEEFLKKVDHDWEEMSFYGYQQKLMFDKLDNQEKENQLNKREEHMQVEEIFDYYKEYGVSRTDFF